MSWTDAHRHYAALREIERELDATGATTVPWHAGYAELFGTRGRLLLALRTRWQTMVEVQVETDVDYLELAAAHPGLVRLLRAAGRAPRHEYALAAGR